MIELLMLFVMPQEINPPKLGMKYLLKTKFVDYKSCEEYVAKNVYEKKEGVYYKIDDKEYKVMLTYCKPVKEKNDN